jgi:hypothetical protein
MRNPYQLLIIPLTLWSGFEQAFLTAEFTAVLTLVLICFGIAVLTHF